MNYILISIWKTGQCKDKVIDICSYDDSYSRGKMIIGKVCWIMYTRNKKFLALVVALSMLLPALNIGMAEDETTVTNIYVEDGVPAYYDGTEWATQTDLPEVYHGDVVTDEAVYAPGTYWDYAPGMLVYANEKDSSFTLDGSVEKSADDNEYTATGVKLDAHGGKASATVTGDITAVKESGITTSANTVDATGVAAIVDSTTSFDLVVEGDVIARAITDNAVYPFADASGVWLYDYNSEPFVNPQYDSNVEIGGINAEAKASFSDENETAAATAHGMNLNSPYAKLGKVIVTGDTNVSSEAENPLGSADANSHGFEIVTYPFDEADIEIHGDISALAASTGKNTLANASGLALYMEADSGKSRVDIAGNIESSANASGSSSYATANGMDVSSRAQALSFTFVGNVKASADGNKEMVTGVNFYSADSDVVASFQGSITANGKNSVGLALGVSDEPDYSATGYDNTASYEHDDYPILSAWVSINGDKRSLFTYGEGSDTEYYIWEDGDYFPVTGLKIEHPERSTLFTVEGNVNADQYGVQLNTSELAQLDLIIDGEVNGGEAGIVLMEEASLTDSVNITVWQVEPVGGAVVYDRGEYDPVEDEYALVKNEEAEKRIQYIIRIKDDEVSQKNISFAEGTESYEYKPGEKAYTVANENDKVVVKLSIPEGKKLVGAYWNEENAELLQGDDGNYYMFVPKGGGVILSMVLEDLPEPEPEPQPGPQPDPDPDPQPGPQPDPDPEPQPGPQPDPDPDPQPGPQPDPDPDPQPDPQPAPKPAPKPQPQPQPRPKPQPDEGAATRVDESQASIVTLEAFCEDLVVSIFRAKGSSTIRADARNYDGLNQNVLMALIARKDVTLVLITRNYGEIILRGNDNWLGKIYDKQFLTFREIVEVYLFCM